MNKKLLTVPEVAEHLRVSRSTVWRWCKDGTLTTAFKVGRNWRIHRVEVEQFIDQGLGHEYTNNGNHSSMKA